MFLWTPFLISFVIIFTSNEMHFTFEWKTWILYFYNKVQVGEKIVKQMKKQINNGTMIDDNNWCNADLLIFNKKADSVQCDECQKWNHYKCHLHLFEDEYPLATEQQKWSCWKCKKGIINTAEKSLQLVE